VKDATDEKKPKRKLSEYQIFIKSEIPRQRDLRPGLTQKEYMAFAAVEWQKKKEDDGEEPAKKSGSKTAAKPAAEEPAKKSGSKTAAKPAAKTPKKGKKEVEEEEE